MKHLTIFLLTLITFSSYGQKSSKDGLTSDFKRVQVGINISPDICFRTLKNNDGSFSSELVITQRNNIEIYKVGYSAGLNFCLKINKTIGLETGIQYSKKGYQTKKQDLIFGQPDPSLPNKSKFINVFHYIDIPLKMNFTMGNKKMRFFTSVGATTNILIKATQVSFLYYSDRTDKKTSSTNYNYKKVNISPTISVGIDYKINERMNLRVEPTFRYGALKISDTPVTGYLYNGGLNISFYSGL